MSLLREVAAWIAVNVAALAEGPIKV